MGHVVRPIDPWEQALFSPLLPEGEEGCVGHITPDPSPPEVHDGRQVDGPRGEAQGRRHHAPGAVKNFASIFPFIDTLFGTAEMPPRPHRRPRRRPTLVPIS